MHPLDVEGRPPIHSAVPGFAVIAAGVVVTLIVLLPRRLTMFYWIPMGILLVLWPLFKMPFLYGVRRLLLAEFFILGMALVSLVHPATAPIFLSAVVKSNLCVLTLLLLTWMIPFHEILQQLRRWHFPSIMLSTLTLMYRYLPVLGEETRRMTRARASRTFARKPLFGWQAASLIIGQLFSRTMDRAERIYLAMCARGWK